MKYTLKPIQEQVVVITGATSGIGLATAESAVKQGAKVVLAARNEAALLEIAQEFRGNGGEVVTVTADVSQKTDVQRIADQAIIAFGGFDTWVNNAGTSIFGLLREVSEEDHRRLFETNFWGAVYGCLIAVEHLRKSGGAIINVGSVASDISLPLQGMYSATKHALKGMTDALRMELESEGLPISVTLIKPTSINTPFPQRARNYLDHEPKLPDPVYAPDEVAYAILYAAQHPCRDLNVGGVGKAMTVLSYLFPRFMDRFSERIMMPMQQREEAPREPEGSLKQPVRDGRIHGDHPNFVIKKCLYSRAVMHPVATGAVLASVGVITAMMLNHGRR